jgi:hypothetical protein
LQLRARVVWRAGREAGVARDLEGEAACPVEAADPGAVEVV